MALDRDVMATFITMQNSPNTQETYQRGIDKFVMWLYSVRKIKLDTITWGDITEAHAVGWKQYMAMGPLADASASAYWDGVKSFYNYLVATGKVPRNPFAAVKKPQRIVNQQREIPGDTDVTHMLTKSWQLSPDKATNMRNRAMIGMLANGLRVSEVVALDSTDLFRIPEGRVEGVAIPPTYAVKVRGKGNKERIVPLQTDWVYQPLAEWLSYRGLWGPGAKTDPEPMFVTTMGERISVRLLQHVFDRVRDQAGYRYRKWSPHSLRHNYATRLLRAGASIAQVQKLLGHASMTTTAIYLHLDTSDIVAASKMDTLGY